MTCLTCGAAGIAPDNCPHCTPPIECERCATWTDPADLLDGLCHACTEDLDDQIEPPAPIPGQQDIFGGEA